MIHETAEVSDKAKIGKDVSIWNQAQIREDAVIGDNSIISKNVYVDFSVKIGKNVKIQNNSSIFHGVVIEDGVFIGPHVCLTNDNNPRAVNPDLTLKKADDWEVSETLVKEGASIGAGSIILPGITIGKFAMVGAGSVVTKDVSDFALVYGNPAKLKAFVCKCGFKLDYLKKQGNSIIMVCSKCKEECEIAEEIYKKIGVQNQR